MTQLRFPCCALVLGLLAVLQTIHISYAAPNSKSVETHKPPSIADYDLNFQQSGIIKNREALMRKPRAIVGYVSSAQWAFEEFLSMMHASWAHLIELEEQQLRDSAQRNGQERGNSTAHNSKLDLLIFIDNRWYPQVATFCTPLQLAPEYIREAGTDSRVTRALQAMSAASDPDISQCHLILYPPPDLHVWFGYPYINNVHYLADPAIAAMLLSNYGYVMKTDLDAFLTPSWLSYYPTSFEFGTQEYVLLRATSHRLRQISARLQLQHRGVHNLGPTWYGDAGTIVALANLSIPIMHHIITKEFPQNSNGPGIAQNWATGEGWPEWNAGIAALYATEIAANHLLYGSPLTDSAAVAAAAATAAAVAALVAVAAAASQIPAFAVAVAVASGGGGGGVSGTGPMPSLKYDTHADATVKTNSVWHIHCRHGDGDFSKIQFLTHHYDTLPEGLVDQDPGVVRGYATRLAVGTWRALREALTSVQGGQQEKKKGKTEL